MEDFKDVMLSEPPQRYAAPVSHTNNTTSNALSLESYKGILLCDRPADTRANRAAQQNPPFLPPGNTEMDRGNGNLGLQPSLEARAKIGMSRGLRTEAHRTQHPPTALSKHRRWLSSFASEVKKMQQDKADQLVQTKAKMESIREREAAKRRGEGTLVTSDAGAVVDAPRAPLTPPAASTTTSLPPIGATKKAANGAASTKKSKSKPKWAMTEEEAEDAEFAAARELMDFAAELDFDTFIKDFEVQEALAIMRDRVKEIAAEKGIDIEAARQQARGDDTNDGDNDDTMSIMTVSTTTGQPKKVHRSAKQQQKKMAERDEEGNERPTWDDSTGNSIRGALQSDALKLAERVLQSSDALRKVHSKMSMARLLQDVALEMNLPLSKSVYIPGESSVPQPVVSIVAAEATGATGGNNNASMTQTKRVLTEMRHSKTKVQNLPYLYRCPSI